MTDGNSAAATAGPNTGAPAAGGSDDSVATIRQRRDAALRAGDRETAQEFDALERELYDAEAEDDRPEAASPDDAEAAAFTGADHTPLTGDEMSGVFGFLEEVDPQAAASLRREWGGDAAANLGFAHLWFTTRYTQAERDSMVVTPGLVSMAARMGRKFAAERRAAEKEPQHGGGGAGSLREPAELRRLRQEAQRNGNYRLARELDAQERAAWARLNGDAPIVGRAGRNL